MYDIILPSMFSDNPEMTTSYVASVVITGLTVVFLALLILIFFFKILGFIFGREKKPKTVAKTEEVKPVAVAEPAVSVAPVIDDGVEEEIVAVIMAAIAAMSEQSGKKLRLASIKPSSRASRPAWAQAGLIDNTRPF